MLPQVSYHNASKVVKPKLEALRVAEKRLEKAQSDLDVAARRLTRCREVLEKLQSDFEEQMAEKTRIAENASRTKRRMEQATRLISGLAGERVRWTADSREFAEIKKRLVGDCAVAAAFLSYCGPFNQAFRGVLVANKFIRCAGFGRARAAASRQLTPRPARAASPPAATWFRGACR